MPAPIGRDTRHDVHVKDATVIWAQDVNDGKGGYPLPGHTRTSPLFVPSQLLANQMARQINQEMERGA